MEVNLAIVIFNHVLVQQSSAMGQSVRLSKFRDEYGIPRSTFFRHVGDLINNRMIVRYGRDRYGIHHSIVHQAAKIRKVVEVK